LAAACEEDLDDLEVKAALVLWWCEYNKSWPEMYVQWQALCPSVTVWAWQVARPGV
jgi:hypothetical protein